MCFRELVAGAILGLLWAGLASAQTLYYVDPTYTGSTQNGAAATPWKSLSGINWTTINSSLASGPVTVYVSARQAASDTKESLTGPLEVQRTDTSSHRLTLDGNSKYNTNEASPSWADYTGTHKAHIHTSTGSLGMGWETDDVKRHYITMRGFEISGRRVVWGGSHTVIEDNWIHDITNTGATVQLSQAVSDYPECEDWGKVDDVIVRRNRIERGIGESIYISGNYTFEEDGGCPAYGNAHTNILIEDNTIIDAGENGGQGDGIDLKAGLQGVIVRRNTIIRPGNDGITTLSTFNGAAANYLIEHNVFLDGGGYGMSLNGCRTCVVQNNIVAGFEGLGISLGGDDEYPNVGVDFFNNTLSGNGTGLAMYFADDVRLRNNLAVGNGTDAQLQDWGDLTNIDSDWNFLAPDGSWLPEGNNTIVQESTSGIFVNPGGNDFHLASNSPAVDAGEDLSSLGVDEDYEGDARPQGNGYDIGADESDGSAEPPAAEDTTPPAVSITAPPDNGTVKAGARVTVKATASDESGSVSKVVLGYKRTTNSSYTNICTDSSAPYSCTWKVPSGKNRSYHLRARATDPAGNTGEHIITVRVP
jgi:hypothetical protein